MIEEFGIDGEDDDQRMNGVEPGCIKDKAEVILC